ncbi:luciferase-like monooxygenase family protein [Mycobacterium xenopi 3993]|nr:luciferase-like monooxygenase family protein [Mycobacterium xenopi 3993]
MPFAKRGRRIDECIEIVRGLTTGDYFEFHGEFYDIPKAKMTPAPTKPIPILVGAMPMPRCAARPAPMDGCTGRRAGRP